MTESWISLLMAWAVRITNRFLEYWTFYAKHAWNELDCTHCKLRTPWGTYFLCAEKCTTKCRLIPRFEMCNPIPQKPSIFRLDRTRRSATCASVNASKSIPVTSISSTRYHCTSQLFVPRITHLYSILVAFQVRHDFYLVLCSAVETLYRTILASNS